MCQSSCGCRHAFEQRFKRRASVPTTATPFLLGGKSDEMGGWREEEEGEDKVRTYREISATGDASSTSAHTHRPCSLLGGKLASVQKRTVQLQGSSAASLRVYPREISSDQSFPMQGSSSMGGWVSS